VFLLAGLGSLVLSTVTLYAWFRRSGHIGST
jgi:hypothetical protein